MASFPIRFKCCPGGGLSICFAGSSIASVTAFCQALLDGEIMSMVPRDITRAALCELFSEETSAAPQKRQKRDSETSTQYDDNMKVAFWRVSNKRSERSPDFEGRLTINGVTYNGCLWERTSNKGGNYLSGNLKRY